MATTHRLCHSFCQRTDYQNLPRVGEEVILLVLRAHPITNVPWILQVFLMSLIPILLSPFYALSDLNYNQVLFVIALWYAILISFSLSKIFFWYYNLGVITNKRIIDIDAVNLLNNHTTATTIEKVEEVSKKSLGMIAGFFDYANILVQTAGEFPNIEYLKTPNPSEVIKIINNLQQKNRER